MSMLPLILMVIVAAAFTMAAVGVRGLLNEVPQDERVYQDPLPFFLRMLWPLVSAATFVIGPRLKSDALEVSHRRLQAAGQDFLVSPEELAGLRIVSAGVVVVFILFVLLMLGYLSLGSALLGVVFGVPLGYFYPSLWLSDRRKTREKKVIKDLPVFLDFITMSVEAGLNITGAIEQAVTKCPAGPLSQEFSRMLRDLRAGLPRAEALRRLSDRMDIPQISSFTTALIQADRVGSSLGETLRAQAMQRREERFLRAEKLALEAPVKMMGPLIMFFFPLIFLILAYFIYLKLVEEGMVGLI